jgi:hypothetical protein
MKKAALLAATLLAAAGLTVVLAPQPGSALSVGNACTQSTSAGTVTVTCVANTPALGVGTWTPPTGVSEVSVDVEGGHGGAGGAFPGSGGPGGKATGTLPVTPASTVGVVVCGKGGDAGDAGAGTGGLNGGKGTTSASLVRGTGAP